MTFDEWYNTQLKGDADNCPHKIREQRAWEASLQEAAKVAYSTCIGHGMSAGMALSVSDAILYT